ncbi:uncharacterized protein PV09_02758 [Verruconis gallopava]|uniref:RING-CH-type domain-containing protein n=1 Tax=Verruconis gallopava TaxID=253628 RepID=A0A0D2B4X7_9PEZI|nr:uncharacterized protein PV09_02758 [Verruconis gallopava]KIW06289.1 hypothetical protein PV09_02758 [Verruconis gallopava]
MSTSGFQAAAPGSWQWPDDIPQPRSRTAASEEAHEVKSVPQETTHGDSASTSAGARNESENAQRRQRHWRPRTCRICLETVQPTFTQPSEEGYFQSGPKVVYESEDGGRLLRPCKCKGTSKYVHEGCLQAWRHADPSYGKRNFFQCPTCGYKYRLQRLGWGRFVTSVATQIVLTVVIMLTVVFILGFIADPIINFALDPYGTIFPSFFPGFSFQIFSFGDPGLFYDVPTHPVIPPSAPPEPTGWIEHFIKGFAGLGLMSFLKFMLSSPINFFFRQGGVGGRQTGRDRLNTITWVMILVGVATFLYAVWKGVRNLSRRTLEKAGERVLDVQGDDDDEDDEDH